MKLTPAQRRTLQIAIDDKLIVIGGIDATPNVRRDVVYKLAGMKLLQWKAPKAWYEESEWIPTELAKEILG